MGRASAWDNERVLEINGGDGSTMSQNNILKNG